MTTATIRVRAATTADIPALAATHAEAFQSDPVLTWCFPDPERRAQLLPEVFRTMLHHTIAHGGVETVDDDVAGSIWVPPAAEVDDEAMGSALIDLSGDDAERVATLLETLDEHHPAVDEHQYLFVLSTRTAWQSKGLGSALLRAVTAECDRDGLGAYLEATSERNRSLYERHGFETTAVLQLPDGPPLYAMWRTPQ